MKKTFLSVMMLIAGIVVAMAQQMQLTPLPLMQECKSGVLPNGLSYYVIHNSEPKERANFYIAQKVGSTLEEPDQLGLAHFLEHMAFNGTTHYPGKDMLNYLQNKGIRFGADINAYTAFDETVYNIDNVPTTDAALMDSVLLVIRDWCDGILLEEDEINSERGVIQEEWRQRNDAQTRMYTTILPQIYDEYQYEQMPIGSMDVVMNFKPETLRAYYKKWYRPDQQGIVVVGDFDAAEMEKKVIALFSTVVMPEGAAERVYPTVSDNEEPIFVTYEDPELQSATISISFKSEKTPWEMRNTVEGYIQDAIAENVIASLLNNRLQEYMANPECPYAYAGVYFSDFYVSKTKAAFNVVSIPKGNNFEQTLEGAVSIVARACKTGFTQSEYERVKTEILANYEKMYEGRNSRKNEAVGKELIRHFVDNEAAPGIEVEYQLAQQIFAMLPLEAFNQMAEGLLTPNNQVIVLSQPKAEGNVFPTKEQFINKLESLIGAEYEAYVDEVITEPLIGKMRKPGKIKKETTDAAWGTTNFVLSNGAKVIVKKTDFADNQILMTAFREGGKTSLTPDQAANAELVGLAIDNSKNGNFDIVKMQKYLAGKQLSLDFGVNSYTDVFEGSTTVKDLPTFMEILYSYFTQIAPDPAAYKAAADRNRTMIANQDKNPEKVFFDRVATVSYGNNPMAKEMTAETIDAANYDQMLKMAKEATANAADYTFVFVGDVDINTLKPLLETYIASLPSKGKARKVNVVTPIEFVKGEVKDESKLQMEAPCVWVYDQITGNMPSDVANNVLISLAGNILDNIYTTTLREEEGGTYGAHVWGGMNPNTNEWQLAYFYQTNDGQKQTLIDRAHAEAKKLFENGANAEEFNKVRLAAIKQLEIQQRQNGYWTNNIMAKERGINLVDGRREFLEQLTLDQMNAFLRGLANAANHVEVIIDGVAK